MLQQQRIIISVVVISAAWYLFNNYNKGDIDEVKVYGILNEWRSKGSFFNYNGHNIFFIDDKTDKEVLLILHGFPTSTWDFASILPELSTKFRVVMFDLIGFGFSDKPKDYNYSIVDQAEIALSLLEHQNIREFHILAHDLGDSVAQEILAVKLNGERRSEKLEIKSVVFMNGGLFPQLHRPLLIQKLFANSIVGPYVHYFMNKLTFGLSMKKIFGPETPPSPLEISCLWELINVNDGPAIQHKLLGYINERKVYAERWVKVIAHPNRLPMRFINGPADPISGIHMAEYYKTVAPNGGDVALLKDKIGHYPHMEDPSGVLVALNEFWSTLK